MVYREVEVRAPEPTSDVLLRIDASGAAGAHARDGHAGADGGGGGAHGAPGGHAGAASPGGHGGRVEVTLAAVGSSVEITGTRRGHAERERRAVREQRDIGEQGFLDLVARGGAGGHGGRGGDGGAGARGRSGSNATRWSHGGNGGRGGDGGAGGHGTSGRDGGAGGAVVVRVRDEDTHLLMLVRHGIEGGAGGRAGRHGAGGAAGAGGAGGASHSWTTTESYRDSQGKTQTRTRFHSNPGGSSGPSGHPGPSGHGPLSDGARGPDGAFVIEVERAGGTEHFAERYHLVLAGLEIHTPDADGVTEPGERVELRRVRVTNVGGMPTPRHRDVRVEAVESNWVRPMEGAALLAPRGLAAGESAELEGILPFQLRDYATTAGSDPLTEREPLVLDGRVPDVSRSFEGFLPAALDEARTLTVRFPVAASVLEALPSLAPGEVSRLRFAIRNVSRSAVGASSPARRRLRVRLHLHESELDDRHVVLFDEHGLPQLLGGDGLVRELDLLEPGADFTFEGALGVLDDAPTYRALRVRLTLELGRLETPEVLRVVQHRELELRVAEQVGERDFDWLLVTHHRTTREEVDAWRALAERQGQRLAIFDLSLHGDLALERPFEGGASLLARARGGLVILLGYPMSTPDGERAPTSFLSSGLLASMSEQRVDLLVVGGDGSLRDWVAPEGLVLDPEAAPLEGSDALLAHLQRLRERSEAPEDGPGRDGAEVAVRVRVDEIVFGLEAPDEARLAQRAQALAERLARLFPEREHEVVHELDPDLTPSWAPVRRRRLGWLRVLSRAAGRSGLAHLALEPEDARDPSKIGGAEVATATLLARGVDDRVRALAETLTVERPDTTLATALADALVVSIACEQLAVLRRTRARSGLSRESLARALGALRTLSETRLLGAHEVGSHAGATIARLVARARFFARAQASLWERIPGLSWTRRAGVLVSLTDELTHAFLARQSGSDEVVRGLEDRVRVEQEALDQGWRAARAGGLREPAAYARALVLAPTWSTSFTVDDELVLSHEPRAIPAAEWAAARATTLGARAAVHATEEGLDALRARLLVPARTRDLLVPPDEPTARAGFRSRAQDS